MALPTPTPDGPGRETGIYGRFLGQVGVDGAIARLAAAQHVVFGLDQLQRLGLSASAVHKRAAARRLHRVHRAVYSLVPPSLLTREGLWMAAVLACGLQAVLSHGSAAALHELRAYGSSRVDVTIPARSGMAHAGVRIHRSTTLAESDITIVRGIPCTTVARTLLDLGDVLGRRALERACDQAEILQTFDLTALTDQLTRNPHRRGTPTLKAILEEHYIGQTPTWSELEERFLTLITEAGLPRPEVNAYIDPGDGEPPICVDFVWRAQRLAVETDGRRYHQTRHSFEEDRRRDQRLTAAGWRIIRTTWRQITHAPRQLQRTLLALTNG